MSRIVVYGHVHPARTLPPDDGQRGSSGGPGADGFVPAGGTVDGEIIDGVPGTGRGPAGDGAGTGGRPESVPGPSTALVLRHAGTVAGTAVGTVARRVGHRTASVTVQVLTTARIVVTHDRTKTVVRWAVRNAVIYVITGGWVAAVRLWEARTNARYERMMRTAEAAGDQDRLVDWETRAEHARDRRHRRRMDWIAAPFAVARAVAVTGATVAGMLLALGVLLAFAHSDASWVLAPIGAVIDAMAWVVWLLTVTWLPLVLAAPWVGLAALWQVGRSHGTVPAWAAPATVRDDASVIVTPGGIATALAHLGIPALNRANKEGWQVEFSMPPVRVNGRGYQTVFSLPMGVTPEMIADKRDVLARNLVRAPLEVWPAAADHAGYVELWVADPGSTEKPAPPYPLLHEGTADVFAGIPLGVSQRGDVIAPALPGANVVFGGVMGQGKSNAARVMMAGAALDPIAELWVFVFANNGDFDAYRPRLARYHRGVDDATTVAALESLRDLYAEVGRREARLAALGAKKVTRSLALAHPDLRPLVALFSECHELFGHDEHGKEAADLAVQTMRRGRKTAISLAFDTQSSRADAIPPKIVELVKLNACFAVKSWRPNDGFLGDGSFQAGIRATELRMGKDVGTSVLTGATEERFEIVKWFYIVADDDTGYDAAADLIARAMAAVHPSVNDADATHEEESLEQDRDLLTDLDTVMGKDRVPAADVPPLLRELAPEWAPYRQMSGAQLRDILEREYAVKVPSTNNRFPIDPVTIRSRLAARAAADRDDGG